MSNRALIHEIKQKYLKPPTHEQIFGFIKELGVSQTHFELYFQIPYGIIRQVKCGARPLPVTLWPIFYERIVPQYGLKHIEVVNFPLRQEHPAKPNKKVKLPNTSSRKYDAAAKSRLTVPTT